MSPDEVAELSRLLDKAQALGAALREPWLNELERSKPQVAQRLRDMLQRAETVATKVLPDLPKIDPDEAIARAGERVGPYQLVQEIGRGGMGSVWLAERADGAYKRRVALKLPRLAWAAGLGKRMARERDIGALLEHPNIARLYDAGLDEHGRPYIAMEYIDGQPIDVYCREHVLDLRTKLKLFVEVTQAVAYAHGRLVLHRDLKPANVLVDASGHVHLLDFGIAKLLDEAWAGSDLTQEQGRVLTLSYASPEQIAGRPLGVTADVYSLGVLLFELLTGTLPFKAKRNTIGAMEEAILEGDSLLASGRVDDKKLCRALRGDLDAILTKAIRRDAGARYQTAEALGADIQRYLDGIAIEARPDSTWYRLRKAFVRHRLPVMAAAAVSAVGLIGLTTTLLQGRRAADEAERARLATAFVSELFRVNATQAAPTSDAPVRASPAVFVDQGAQLIEARFHGQPELQAELYGAVGQVYVDLGVDRLATEYAMRQLKSLREQKSNGPRIARALMLLAEAALVGERDVDARDYALEALAVLGPNSENAPDALALLARTQLRTFNSQEAARNVAEGKRLIKVQGRQNSMAAAWLTFIDGVIAGRQGRREKEAWSLIDAAIGQAIDVDGPQSSVASEMRLSKADWLITKERFVEGRRVGEAAIASLEATGGIGRLRAARARAKLQYWLVWHEDVGHSDAIAILEETSAFLRSQAAIVPPEVRAEVTFMTAAVHFKRGDYALAASLFGTSAPLLEQSTQSLRRRAELAMWLGETAMIRGDDVTADRLLRQLMDIRVKMGQGEHPYAANTWCNVAKNMAMAGRPQEGLAFLRTAPSFGKLPGEPFDGSPMIAITTVDLLLDIGDVDEALKTWPTDLPDPPADYPHIRPVFARLKCASGDPVTGVAEFKRSIEEWSRRKSDNDPHLARIRSLAGLCTLAQGNRKLAEELARDARRAFTAQPDVSSYFKEPLARLEQQLGAKAI